MFLKIYILNTYLELINYYYDQWNRFICPIVDKTRVADIIIGEIYRLKKEYIINRFKLNKCIGQEFNEVLITPRTLKEIRKSDIAK